MREIVDGIVPWSWLSEPHGYDFNGYFVRHSAGNLCIDPVEPAAEVLDLLAREGVARILLTKRKHARRREAGGPTLPPNRNPARRSELVRARTGAAVAIHAADAAHARAQGAVVADELRAGERVGPFVVVPVPGKSPGEVAFHWPERRLLLVGDAVIGNPPDRLSLLPDRVMDDPARLRGSVRAVAELDVDVLLDRDGVAILR